MELFVYDPVTYTRLRIIHLDGLSGPRDIAACQQMKCLFLVVNSSLASIDRKGKLLKQWEVPYDPHNISVTSSGNILLTCNARILIYSSDGNIIQDLGLDANACNLSWQTLLLNSGDYLQCQGWLSSDHHRVLTLSREGTILKSFGSERQQNSNSHLSDPVNMAMDKDKLIFVADSGNSRVVLLSPGLVYLRELLGEKDEVFEPYRVLLDEASGFLYVGTNDSQLLVFSVFK